MQSSAEPAASPSASIPARAAEPDQRVMLQGMTWKDYEIVLAVRGDRSGVRMAYANGVIELMSPSVDHEGIKKTIARLIEAYIDERGLEVNGYGSWTLKNPIAERALEPDECYVLGSARKAVPDLAIEVVWTHGGLRKLDIYRALGVGEVWVWEQETGIVIHVLREGRYEVAEASTVLPGLDVKLVERLAVSPSQAQAVRELRRVLREGE